MREEEHFPSWPVWENEDVEALLALSFKPFLPGFEGLDSEGSGAVGEKQQRRAAA